MRAPEHAPRGTFNLHERRHGLAEIVERGAVVMVVSTTRRVFGGAHPLAMNFEESLRRARAALRAREE